MSLRSADRTGSGGYRRLLAAALVGLVALVLVAAPDGGSFGPIAAATTLTGDDPLIQILHDSSSAALARTDDLRASSAVTVSGVGATAGMKVTVSQTTNLVNQAVGISWTGAKPTVGMPYFAADYLQIMQCWGDTTPDRTQCQFGGKLVTDTRGGENAASRKVSGSYRDPAEPLTPASAPAGADAFVPFDPVAGDLVTGIDTLKNPYYDDSTTNEIPFAATRGDGSGFETFETQTYREAPGLGCGDIITSGRKKGQPRACWLVIVPRAETEVDGTGLPGVLAGASHRLDSSPLSTTNWAARIVIPLTFAAVGQVCPIAAKQRPLAGSEPVAEAILRWQPALCRNNGPVFSYTQTADSVAERKLLGAAPGAALLTAPVPPGQVPSDRILTYAPVAVSGISFAVMIERQTPEGTPVKIRERDGERITDLRLTPRLAAKLLTQSYQSDVSLFVKYLKPNPANVTKDPDFLALNPQFKELSYLGLETLTPIGLGDANAALWRWIGTDQQALDFLAGLPDPWGMRINPFYQGLQVPRDDFAKTDPYCQTSVTAGVPPLCTLDQHPYASDFHDAARSAARGDALSRNLWDANAAPPAFKKAPLQLNGQRHLLGVTDSASAQRFGVVTARLRNAAGQFVGPTRAGLAAGLATMRGTGVPGVLVADPESKNKAAYPLTTVSYVVTAPNILTVAEAADYARFIRYAAGAGQKAGTGLGNLPDGYLPLTAALRKQALAVAKDVESRRGPVKPTNPRDPDPGGSDDDNSGGSGGGSGSVPGSGDSISPSAAPVVPTPSASLPTAAILPVTAINKTALTTADPKVAGRYALMIALTLGSCALIFGLLLPRLARRLGQ